MLDVLVVSNDKDMMQLVDGNVRVLRAERAARRMTSLWTRRK